MADHMSGHHKATRQEMADRAAQHKRAQAHKSGPPVGGRSQPGPFKDPQFLFPPRKDPNPPKHPTSVIGQDSPVGISLSDLTGPKKKK